MSVVEQWIIIKLESEYIAEGSLSNDMKQRFDDINMKTGGDSNLDVDVDNLFKSDIFKIHKFKGSRW
jgi:hypothetical protein